MGRLVTIFFNKRIIITIYNTMFKVKKNPLFQALTKNKQQILTYLDINSIFELSLTNKKYYMLLNPYINELVYDNQQKIELKVPEKTNKKNKTNKNRKKSNQNSQQQPEDVYLSFQKILMKDARKKLLPTISDWQFTSQCPVKNAYLTKKMQIGAIIVFQNIKTGEILYINRSLVDPNLNCQKGGFDSDPNSVDYEELLQEYGTEEYDFTSKQSMLKRQKQILSKIEESKQQKMKDQQIRYEDELKKVFQLKKVCIILCFGGSFSFGIFQNEKCILHKSDHKYVCRKKAGQRQFNRDKQSGSNIKSMGSQIRRDQEKKHIFNVNQILTTHRKDIEDCDLVFLQAPGLNRLFIVNESETLKGVKSKLRSLCLTAKKANYTQVQSIYQAISTFSVGKIKKQ